MDTAESQAARRVRRQAGGQGETKLYALSSLEVRLLRNLLATRIAWSASADAKAEYKELDKRLASGGKPL